MPLFCNQRIDSPLTLLHCAVPQAKSTRLPPLFAKALARAQRTVMTELQQQGAVDSHDPAAAMERMVAMQRRTNELTRGVAKQFLSARQLQAFDAMQAQQQAQIEADMKLRQRSPGPVGG